MKYLSLRVVVGQFPILSSKHGFSTDKVIGNTIIDLTSIVSQDASSARLIRRTARHAHQIDAVPTALSIRQIVPEVRTIHAHRLAVRQDADEIPVDLPIAKARPTVIATLPQELVHRPAAGGVE